MFFIDGGLQLEQDTQRHRYTFLGEPDNGSIGQRSQSILLISVYNAMEQFTVGQMLEPKHPIDALTKSRPIDHVEFPSSPLCSSHDCFFQPWRVLSVSDEPLPTRH
jgi:hypothetical protein